MKEFKIERDGFSLVVKRDCFKFQNNMFKLEIKDIIWVQKETRYANFYFYSLKCDFKIINDHEILGIIYGNLEAELNLTEEEIKNLFRFLKLFKIN